MARMRVFIDGLQPLIWKTTLEFDDGRELVVTLVYEKLHNHCTTCYSLGHDKEACPDKPPTPAPLRDNFERQTSDRSCPPQHNSLKETSSLSRSNYQSAYRSSPQNFLRSNSRGSFSPGPERHRKNHERRAEPYKVHNHPSTERTLTVKVLYRDGPIYESARREDSYNTYQSREYRRYEQSGSRRGHQHPRPARSLWVEKPNQKDHIPLPVERSESSRLVGQPIQNVIPPPPPLPVEVHEEAISQAREEIRDYMMQYTNYQDPTESAACKERLRKAEEQGEIEEAATSLVRNNLVTQALLPPDPHVKYHLQESLQPKYWDL
ncbi:hypothetical protein Bca101_051334 [Brassica carinata]